MYWTARLPKIWDSTILGIQVIQVIQVICKFKWYAKYWVSPKMKSTSWISELALRYWQTLKTTSNRIHLRLLAKSKLYISSKIVLKLCSDCGPSIRTESMKKEYTKINFEKLSENRLREHILKADLHVKSCNRLFHLVSANAVSLIHILSKAVFA